MSDVNLKVIECNYDGIGDAVLYCWIAVSAHAAGRTDVLVNLNDKVQIVEMFLPREMRSTTPGDRFFSDTGGPSKQWMEEVSQGRDSNIPRFFHWSKFYGLEGIPPVRPAYNEHERIAAWADKTWLDYDRKSKTEGRRVLIAPKCAWTSREWPQNYFVDLAYSLQNSGYNTVSIANREEFVKGFPHYLYGHSLFHLAALAKRADLVIANDSGPAHIAGTVGTRTVAICGATRPEIVFGHMLENVMGVRVSNERVWCTGCHFRGDHGWRAACARGCRALQMLQPEEIRGVVDAHFGSARECEPEGRRGAEADAEAVGEGDRVRGAVGV